MKEMRVIAGKCRNNLRDHTESRQDDDVDLGMTKEPEHVLEQYRGTTASCIKEAGAKEAVS